MCFFTRMAQSCQLLGTTHQCLRVFFSSIWHNHVGRLEQLASVNLRFFLVFLVTDISCQPFDSLTCLSPVFFFRIPGGRQVGMVCELQSRRIKSRRTSRAWPSWPFPDNCEQACECLKGALVRSLKLSAPWDVETRGIYLTQPDHPFCGKSFAEDWPVPWSWFFYPQVLSPQSLQNSGLSPRHGSGTHELLSDMQQQGACSRRGTSTSLLGKGKSNRTTSRPKAKEARSLERPTHCSRPPRTLCSM